MILFFTISHYKANRPDFGLPMGSQVETHIDLPGSEWFHGRRFGSRSRGGGRCQRGPAGRGIRGHPAAGGGVVGWGAQTFTDPRPGRRSQGECRFSEARLVRPPQIRISRGKFYRKCPFPLANRKQLPMHCVSVCLPII